MPQLDYRLVDFDNHYYEVEDAFTRHGDAEVNRFVRWVSEGKKRHMVFGNTVGYNIPNPTFNPIGADRVLLGSDWPHLEGTPQPIDYLSQLDKLDAASVQRIMRANGLELLS